MLLQLHSDVTDFGFTSMPFPFHSRIQRSDIVGSCTTQQDLFETQRRPDGAEEFHDGGEKQKSIAYPSSPNETDKPDAGA